MRNPEQSSIIFFPRIFLSALYNFWFVVTGRLKRCFAEQFQWPQMTSGNSIETVIGNPRRSWLLLHIPVVVVAETYAQVPQGDVASLLPFKPPSIPRTGLVDCCSPCHCQVSPPSIALTF
eukprot:EG_transcript_24455